VEAEVWLAYVRGSTRDSHVVFVLLPTDLHIWRERGWAEYYFIASILPMHLKNEEAPSSNATAVNYSHGIEMSQSRERVLPDSFYTPKIINAKTQNQFAKGENKIDSNSRQYRPTIGPRHRCNAKSLPGIEAPSCPMVRGHIIIMHVESVKKGERKAPPSKNHATRPTLAAPKSTTTYYNRSYSSPSLTRHKPPASVINHQTSPPSSN